MAKKVAITKVLSYSVVGMLLLSAILVSTFTMNDSKNVQNSIKMAINTPD